MEDVHNSNDTTRSDLPAGNAVSKQRGRPFTKGTSGNPAGRAQGSRNRVTVAAEQLLDGAAEVITQKAIDLALKGDTTALRICMDRLVPPRKDRPIIFAFSPINTAQDAHLLMSDVTAAMASGAITPSEAEGVSRVIEVYVKTLEASEYEQRIKKLERLMT